MAMKTPKFETKSLILIAAVVLLFLMVMNLNARVSNLNQLTEQQEMVQTEVGGLQATSQSLETQIAFATSEAAVDEWAREEGNLVKPGDIAVIPVPPKNATPSVLVTPTATPQALENWEVWRILFFGE